MRNTNIMLSLLLVVLAIYSFGCAKTTETGKAKPTGFIDDVEMLKEDPDGKVALLYINEEVNFANYDKVWLEPVTIYVFEGSKLAEMPEEKRQELLAYTEAALMRELGKNNEIVSQAGPGVAQMRFALTEISDSNVLIDTVTTYAPPARAFSELKKLVTGKHTGVGQAAFEAEALDSVSGERIAAAMGVRAGGKTVKTDLDRYRDVEAAIDAWAINVAERFENLKMGDTPGGES